MKQYIFSLIAIILFKCVCCQVLERGHCNRDIKPEKQLIAELKPMNGYSCSGKVEILNECDLSVSEFNIEVPDHTEMVWFGSKDLYITSENKINVLLDAAEIISEDNIAKTINNGLVTIDINDAQSDIYKMSFFNYNVIALFNDDNDDVVCYALFDDAKIIVNDKGSINDNNYNSNSTESNTEKNTNTTDTNKNDDPNSSSYNYMLSSFAICVIVFSLLFLLEQ